VKNLEIKARYSGLGNAVQILSALGVDEVWTHKQIDTYFKIPDGKLKLRQVDGDLAELIFYKRPKEQGAKISHYFLFQTDFGENLKNVLGPALHVDLVVEKTRTLYLWENVRIHLDKVVGLGDFIEFEAVLSETEELTESEKRIGFLRQKFRITDEHLIGDGYYELLEMAETGNRIADAG